MEWIDVNERLPEETGRVLVTIELKNGTRRVFRDAIYEEITKNFIYLDPISEENGELIFQRMPHKVVAWMNIPQPYEGD